MVSEGKSSSIDIDADQREPIAIQVVVDCLVEESSENPDFEKCVDKGLDECNLTKKYPCGLCSLVCKSKGGLTLHTRAKHADNAPVVKSVLPIDSDVVCEMVSKAAGSIVNSELYGEPMANLITTADFKPSEHLVKMMKNLYAEYCERLDRDKLLKNFYKLIHDSSKMFTTKSDKMYTAAYNLVVIHLPDLLVGFYKRGNIKEKLPNVKPIEKSEYGLLSYVAGYIISKMYRKSKFAVKQTPEQVELQSCCCQ